MTSIKVYNFTGYSSPITLRQTPAFALEKNVVFRSVAIIQTTSEVTHSSVQNQREVIFLFASPPSPADTTVSNKKPICL